MRNLGLKALVSLSMMGSGLFAELPLAKPLTEVAAIEYALEHNENLLALRASKDSGWEGYQKVRAENYPQLTASGTFKVDKYGTENSSSTFTARQPIFNTGITHRTAIAKERARIIDLDLLSLEISMRYEVRAAYYGIILAKQQMAVALENLEFLKESVAREQQSFNLGHSTNFELDRAKVAYQNAVPRYYKNINALRKGNNQLASLLSIPTEKLPELQSTEIPIDSLPLIQQKLAIFEPSFESIVPNRLMTSKDISDWQKTALEKSPVLRKGLLNIGVSEEEYDQARQHNYPTISGFGTYSCCLKTGLSDNWSTGLSLSWTLFDGAANKHNIDAKEASLRQKQHQYAACLDSLMLEIQDRLDDIEEGIVSFETSQAASRLAQDSMDLAQERLDLGLITPLEYRDATRSLLEARVSRDSAAFQLLKSYYALIQSSGLEE